MSPIKSATARSEYQTARQARLRREWLETNGPCRQCGSSDRLEVDHIDPAAKVSHRIWSWSKARRDAELAKCQPLCYRCHKRKTAEQMNKPVVHGLAVRYRAHGCRCEACTTAHRERAAIERQSRKNRRNSRGETRTLDLVIMSDAL